MTRDDTIIRESVAELNRRKAERLTDSQLRANIDTFRSSVAGSVNWRWRQACLSVRDCRLVAAVEKGRGVSAAVAVRQVLGVRYMVTGRGGAKIARAVRADGSEAAFAVLEHGCRSWAVFAAHKAPGGHASPVAYRSGVPLSEVRTAVLAAVAANREERP